MGLSFDVPETRTRTLSRPRVGRKLSTDSALTIVYGVAGSGKSTAVALWARSAERGDDPLVWVSLRSDDSDMSLWQRIARAVGAAFELDELAGLAGDAYPEVCRALSQRGQKLTLVVDDYHHISAPATDGRIRDFLERCGSVRVVITTRTESTLHSLDSAARLGTVLITAETLAFTDEETLSLVSELDYGGDREELAQRVHAATRGWPLASGALFAEAARQSDSIGSLLKAASAATDFAAEFVRSTLRRHTTQESDFLLRASLADELTVAMAAEMSGLPAETCERLLLDVEAEGIGTWQWRTGTRWFRFHPLLQETFEREAEEQLAETEVRSVRTYISDVVVHERPVRAFEMAVRAQDWDRVEAIIAINWFALSYYTRPSTVKWMSHIPRSEAVRRPVLINAKALHAFATPHTPLEEMTKLYELMRATKDHPVGDDLAGAFAELGRVFVFRSYGDIETSSRSVQRAHDLLAAQPLAVREAHAHLLPMFHVQVGLSRLADGRTVAAMGDFALAHDLITDRSRGGEISQALGCHAMTRALRGEMKLAAELTAQHRREVPYDGWTGAYLQLGYHVAEMLLATNEWDGERALREYQAVAETEPVVELWAYLAIAKAQADTLVLGPQRAYAALRETFLRKKMRPPAPPLHRSAVLGAGAELLLLSGQPARAEQLLHSVELETAETKLARARLALATGNPAAAMGLVDELMWQGEENPQARMSALLITAAAALESGDNDRAADMFSVAMREVELLGLSAPLLYVQPSHLSCLRDLTDDYPLLDEVPDLGRENSAPVVLSPAEVRVLQAVRDTGSVRDAAESLHLSVHTVRFHLKRTYRKLAVGTRQEAVASAQTRGLI